MMRKVLCAVLVGALVCGVAFARSRSTNTYQAASNLTADVKAWNFRFPNFSSRDLIIVNDDSTYDCWFTASTYTVTSCDPYYDSNGNLRSDNCMLLKAGGKLELYDYITDGVSFVFKEYAASPLSVMIAY